MLSHESPKLLVDFARQKRLAEGISQQAFARMMGVSRGCIEYWEHQFKVPGILNRLKLVEFVGFDPEAKPA